MKSKRFWQKVQQVPSKFLRLNVHVVNAITIVISILSLVAFLLGVRELYFLFHQLWEDGVRGTHAQGLGLIVQVVSTLKNFLLSYILFYLSFGIHKLLSVAPSASPLETAASVFRGEIEEKFIGIIIVTLLVVLLERTLQAEKIDQETVQLGLIVAGLMVASAVYIKLGRHSEEAAKPA